MYALTLLIYPLILVLLCVGAGLLVDFISGGEIPGALLAVLGAATLLGVSQLSTYWSQTAPWTPEALVVVALAGFVLGWRRLLSLRLSSALLWPLGVSALVFVAALSPELFSGHISFSSYMVLDDAAFHIQGADYLLHHGQSFSHLNLSSSYGLYLKNYYGSGYPSGADTFFGGSSFLLRLPLIWSFQPFNALMLALAAAPAWVLAKHMGLKNILAATAALTVSLPALVFAYELIASVKEITALPMILTLGALIITYSQWHRRRIRDVVPFALLVAAGVSALSLAFGAWVAGAAFLFAASVLADADGVGVGGRRLIKLSVLGTLIVGAFAWPTWTHLQQSLHVTTAITTTKNPGNLQQPLKFVQLFGVWLSGSYKSIPAAGRHELTYVLIALTFGLAVLGALYLIRGMRTRVLGIWLFLSIAVLAAISFYGSTWSDAKTLMLTSPLVMLFAWGGVTALNSKMRVLALALAVLLSGGVIASDLFQYHASNMAPLARYNELASINSRFAGEGPTLDTDFDEYAIYVLRDLDVSGPDFAIHPPTLTVLARYHGAVVELNRAHPALLRPYKLIITRRNPESTRPPGAYTLVWSGNYYDVWKRTAKTATARLHISATAANTISCKRVAAAAGLARRLHRPLIVSRPVPTTKVDFTNAHYPHAWVLNKNKTLFMNGAGSLQVRFDVPATGLWKIWLRGEIMRAVKISVDGHTLAIFSDQLDGDNANPNTTPPTDVRLRAGIHLLTLTRGGLDLSPGNGGAASIHSIFLSRGADTRPLLKVSPTPVHVRSLCRQRLSWIEVNP